MDTKKALLAKREKPVLSPKGALSTGSTLLNLACTDDPNYGFIKGRYYYLIGDSTSGKTWLTMTCFAESRINDHFKDYRLIFDDVEGGAMMDVEDYFGKEVARKLERVESESVEDFYRRLFDLIESGERFIYVLDSQDGLDSAAAKKKFGKQKKAAEEGQESKGSFGDGKAKIHSENIRWVMRGLKRTKSILIIIGQTRDNVGNPFSFEKKTRSGGKALKFYATLEIWTSVGKKLKKKVRGIPRTVGSSCIAEVRKNRVTGKTGRDRSVVIPIYFGFGIDDVGSCVDFLTTNNYWKKRKGPSGTEYEAHDIEFRGSRKELIAYIEKTGSEVQLRDTVAKLWGEIEDECLLVDRKRRY